MPLLFAITLFLSATLLFLLQPMVGKMVLPLLGGSPAVWNTCMVFFQATLLGGYLYAHGLTRRFQPRTMLLIHAGLLLLCLIPLLLLHLDARHLGREWMPPLGEGSPIVWLLALLALSVGLPFFVLSASAPLLQKWFTNTGHPSAGDPYFLYGASNLGSMLALLGYPTLVEPNLSLLTQTWLWIVGYGVLIGLTIACGLVLWQQSPVLSTQYSVLSTDVSLLAPSPSSLSLFRRLRWVALAFVPSSAMLGVTTYITTDIAAIPLLWVLPLALYLLSFILVFSRLGPSLHVFMVVLLPLALTGIAVEPVSGKTFLLTWQAIVLHLAALFVTAMVCHGELARTRPSAHHLTEFYLWMSVGGVLGGVFNTLVAPLLFSRVVEYPLILAGGCLLLPGTELHRYFTRGSQVDASIRLIVGGVGVMLLAWLGARLVVTDQAAAAMPQALRPAARWFARHYGHDDDGVILVERGFFGQISIEESFDGTVLALVHGTTTHGMQATHPDERGEPLTYFHRSGPIGDLFETVKAKETPQRLAVLGMGTGTLAAYAQPGWEMTFYEIDPAIVRIARDPAYFTYLSDCEARGVPIRVVLGDGRQQMTKAPDSAYDMLFMDAFTSDAVPVHLLTREAIELYIRKLAPTGVIVINIANRYLDLEPVIGNLAASTGLHGVVRIDTYDYEIHKYGSAWVVLSPDELAIAPLRSYRGNDGQRSWKPLATRPELGVWTDDYTNLLSVFDWKY